ncbi:YlqD family protein [Thalassobacillus hwangdonensis]|uniref:YlqD family protein n=1 Tax=Thalassobacillus hwangdonensis TaxID=546108 RepID=A0ABW3L0N8_9BACI
MIKKVPVRQILTDVSRQELHENLVHRQEQYERECQQLQFEKKKLENRENYPSTKVTEKFKKEIDTRKNKISALQYKMEQLDVLPNGSELTIDEVDVLITVEEGMDWNEITNEKAIVIKDGVVIQAR